MHLDRTTFCVVAVLVVGLLAGVALTAPFIPNPGLSEESEPGSVLSLRDLKRVALVIEDLPPHLLDLGLSEQVVRNRLVERLQRGRIEVVDDEEAPVVMFLIDEAIDDAAPDAIAFNLTISLRQKVRVERLDLAVETPTWHYSRVALFGNPEAAKMVLPGVNLVVDKLVTKAMLATKRKAS